MFPFAQVITYDSNGEPKDITNNVRELMSKGLTLSEAVDLITIVY